MSKPLQFLVVIKSAFLRWDDVMKIDSEGCVHNMNRSESLWTGLKEQQLQPEKLMNCTGLEAAIMIDKYIGTRWCGNSVVFLADIYCLLETEALGTVGGNVDEAIFIALAKHSRHRRWV
jgi:hypothetical protein